MSTFRFLDDNYAFDSSSAITATSEDINFPVSNMTKHLRSRVWRSSGYFVIGSTNNSIDFLEVALGTEFNATITSGSYTPDELATEIKTQLEAVGAETYTVTYSAVTGKWTIATAGSFLSLLWDTGTNEATTIGNTLGFSTASDSTGSTSYLGGNIAIHTEEAVVFDLQTATQIDSFALLFDPADLSKMTQDVVIKLQASATNSWASPPYEQTLSIDANYDVITLFLASPQTYRYWRVKIVDPKNPYLYVEIAKVILAKATQLTQTPEIGFTDSMVDNALETRNNFGHQYFDDYPIQRQIDFTYSVLTEADVQTLQQMYKRLGKSIPMGIALDTQASLFDKDRFFLYGRFNGDIKVKQNFYTYFDTAFSVKEAF
jgi:hypothetical protein